MFEKVIARRLKKQKSSDGKFEAKNTGYRKIRNREARKMLKRVNLMKRSIKRNGRFGV